MGNHKGRQCLGKWLKENPKSDQVHCVLRYDGDLLVMYCGKVVKLEDASPPVMGARHCVDCDGLKRRRAQDRKKELQRGAVSNVPAGK